MSAEPAKSSQPHPVRLPSYGVKPFYTFSYCPPLPAPRQFIHILYLDSGVPSVTGDMAADAASLDQQSMGFKAFRVFTTTDENERHIENMTRMRVVNFFEEPDLKVFCLGLDTDRNALYMPFIRDSPCKSAVLGVGNVRFPRPVKVKKIAELDEAHSPKLVTFDGPANEKGSKVIHEVRLDAEKAHTLFN